MRLYYVVFGLVALVGIVRAQPFLYTQFPDEMEDAFLGRQNAFTLSNYFIPNAIITGFADGRDNLILQIYSADAINFPPQAVATQTPFLEGFNIPQGSGTVEGVMFYYRNVAFVASQKAGGMIITLATRVNGSKDMLPFALKSYNWTMAQFQSGPNPLDSTHAVQFTRAIVMDEFSLPRVALCARFNTTIYKLLVFNFTTGDFDLTRVVDLPADTAGVPDIIAFPSPSRKGLTTLLLAYPYQISTVNWGVATWRTDEQFNFIDRYSFTALRARFLFKLRLNEIFGNFWLLTVMFQSPDEGMVLKQGIVDDADKSISPLTLASFTGASYPPFSTHVLRSGTVVVVWTRNDENKTIYGAGVTYGAENPIFNFEIPAATETSLIDQLIVTPLENKTFALTQVVRNRIAPSAFINYYAISDCNDTVTTPNENCNTGEGCIRCMCAEEQGWYAFDGFVCIPRCDDDITVGNETCLDSKDPNCKDCQCATGFAINATTSLCAAVSEPTPGPAGTGFRLPLIAAIVLGPVGLGVIIFLAVFFGKKNAKKKKEKKGEQVVSTASDHDIPLTPTGPGATYTSVPATDTDVRTNDHKYGAISVQAVVTGTNSSVDKMNVPYTGLKFIKEIGSGAYGKVFIGEWQRTKVALKINTLASGDEFAREAKLMVDLRPHPNVVQMLGVSSDGPYPVMILEFCDGGSLDQKLFDPSQPFPLSEQLKAISGIAKGLYHLHKNQIVHRDLAARNILLNFNQPKISDFGLSRLVNDTQKGTTRSNVGPIRWMSPESLKSQTYSPKTDVWSFGVVVYEIVARKEPHADADHMAIGLQIRDTGLTPSIPEDCDPCLKEVLQKCWNLDPEQRPSMEELCDILDRHTEENNL